MSKRRSLNHITHLAPSEGCKWIPYERWCVESPDKFPSAELWSSGLVYDYILERMGLDPYRLTDPK